MAHIEIQSTPTSAVGKSVLPRRFVARFIVSSVTSMAGLISIVLTGPVTCRVAAIDPALEAFYLAHVVGWIWSLARMWSLTLEARNRHQTTSIPKPNPKKGDVTGQLSLGRMSAYKILNWQDRAVSSIDQSVATFLELGEEIATRWIQTVKGVLLLQNRRQSRRKPRDQRWALIPDRHEGYISWEQFQEVQRMLTNNDRFKDRASSARRGLALLAGLLRCRCCGRKLMAEYSGNSPLVLGTHVIGGGCAWIELAPRRQYLWHIRPPWCEQFE